MSHCENDTQSVGVWSHSLAELCSVLNIGLNCA